MQSKQEIYRSKVNENFQLQYVTSNDHSKQCKGFKFAIITTGDLSDTNIKITTNQKLHYKKYIKPLKNIKFSVVSNNSGNSLYARLNIQTKHGFTARKFVEDSEPNTKLPVPAQYEPIKTGDLLYHN